MVFSDILALAKAGYTPSDVREFLAAAADNKKSPSPESEKEDPGEKTETEKKENVSHETLEETSDPKKPTERPEEAIDYKVQYEAAMEALKKAQAANTKQQQPQPEDDRKILMDAVANFM